MRVAMVLGSIAVFLTSGCAWKQGPFCAWTREYTNCNYFTMASCRAGLSGDAGYCGANPAYKGPAVR